MSYVLFDIGGTNTRVAISEDLQTFTKLKKIPTINDFQSGIKELIKTAEELVDKKEIQAVAGGIRGTLDTDKRVLIKDPAGSLSKWEEEPLVSNLEKALKSEVFIENDTALAGLGEAHFGAGKEADIVSYITVSTGVGGVKIENGFIDDCSYGFEPGHQILDIDKTILGITEDPTLENLVSGTALERHSGMKPYDIPQTDKIWSKLAEYLAHGLRNTILYWSPDQIVLGGSMIVGNPRILLDDIVKYTAEVLDEVVPLPAIADAELEDENGLYGAMALLDQIIS